jgi:hypothetical protein
LDTSYQDTNRKVTQDVSLVCLETAMAEPAASIILSEAPERVDRDPSGRAHGAFRDHRQRGEGQVTT